MTRYEPGSQNRIKQREIHRYMDETLREQGLAFGYTRRNAWGVVLNRVQVTDGESPSARYEFVDRIAGAYLVPSEEGLIGIRREAMAEIKRLLDDDALYETEWLEDPYELLFLDGTSQMFELASDGRYILAEGDNIDYCRGDEEHCPHSVRMTELLDRVKQILVPAGVPEECFRL